MGKKLNKVLVWTVILALMFSVFSCSVSEGDTWTCPNCGKSGLTKNFCPSCGTARPEDPEIPFEYEIGDLVAFASQEYADTADKLVWTVAAIDGEMVALVCVSTLPEMVVSLMDSDTPEDAAEFVKHILLKKLLSENEAAVIGEMGDFMISDCASFANLPIDKDGKCLVLIVKSSKIVPFLTLTEYAEELADEGSAPATAASTVTPTPKPATAAPKTQPTTAAPTKKPATAVPTVQPTATAAPVVTPTPTAAPTPAYGHPHSALSGILSIDNQGVAGHGRICQVCNAVVGFAVHTYPESWTEDIAPSCTSQGREKKACTVCGYTIYQRIEPNGVHKLGPMEAVNYKGVNGHGQQCSVCLQYINFAAHTYPEAWTADIAPSCTSQGREKKACTVCGSLLYQWIDPTGHHYVDGFCSACGKKEP